MKWIEDIKQMVTDESAPVTREWLEEAQHEVPYCVLPALLFLKHNGVKGNEEVLARLAITCPDRRALALMLGKDNSLINNFYPPENLPETPDTVTTIDRFLDNYGKTSPGEIEAIDRAIFNPQPDYADVLAAQEKQHGGINLQGGDTQDDLINKFIAEQMQLGEQAAQAPITEPIGEQEKAEIAHETIDDPTLSDDSMLSESLAKMYIARHKYSQALEIIEQLSLKFPKNSIYFADQIRFLKKLVLIETLNDKK